MNIDKPNNCFSINIIRGSSLYILIVSDKWNIGKTEPMCTIEQGSSFVNMTKDNKHVKSILLMRS